MRTAAEMSEWIRAESKLVDELSGRLCKEAACVPHENVASWLSDLRAHFERFRAHFHKHMALEEGGGGGYLAPVLECRPELTDEVEHLRDEHREMGTLMTSIYDELCDLTPAKPLMMLDCCRRIQHLVQIINHHEDRENLILSLVFSRDLGTTD
jgi:hypothetical protein